MPSWPLPTADKMDLFGDFFSLSTAALAIIVSPSHPLWPARWVTSNFPALESKFAPYFTIQERATNGKIILESIPDEIDEIGLIATGDQPLIHLWGNNNRKMRVIFLPKVTTTKQLYSNGPEYVILIGQQENTLNQHSELGRSIVSDNRFSLVSKGSLTSRLKRGPEFWYIYCRNMKPVDQ